MKFLLNIDDFVLKYAYYREKVAGIKYLDFSLDEFKVGDSISFEIDTDNEYDINAIKLYHDNLFIGYVHKNFIQQMIHTYVRKGDYKIVIKINDINREDNTLGYAIAFYKKYDRFSFDILNRFKLNSIANDDGYYNLKKNRFGLYTIVETNTQLSSEDSNKIKEYHKNDTPVLLKAKKGKLIEAIAVI